MGQHHRAQPAERVPGVESRDSAPQEIEGGPDHHRLLDLGAASDGRFLAQTLGPHGITSNSICPITTLTPRVAALRTEAEVERIAQLVPLKRLAEPEDHAEAMLFLASDAAAYLNGVTLDVNGGRIMM